MTSTLAPQFATETISDFQIEEGLNDLSTIEGRRGQYALYTEAWQSYVRFRNNGFRQPGIFHGDKAKAECRKNGPNKLLDMTSEEDRPEREHYIDGPIGESAYLEDVAEWESENASTPTEIVVESERVEAAKEICGECPFRQDCLARAITVPVNDNRSGRRNARVISYETMMMWGGRTPDELKKIWRYMLKFWEYDVASGSVKWDYDREEFIVVGEYQS